jgi:hypothetical protein
VQPFQPARLTDDLAGPLPAARPDVVRRVDERRQQHDRGQLVVDVVTELAAPQRGRVGVGGGTRRDEAARGGGEVLVCRLEYVHDPPSSGSAETAVDHAVRMPGRVVRSVDSDGATQLFRWLT